MAASVSLFANTSHGPQVVGRASCLGTEAVGPAGRGGSRWLGAGPGLHGPPMPPLCQELLQPRPLLHRDTGVSFSGGRWGRWCRVPTPGRGRVQADREIRSRVPLRVSCHLFAGYVHTWSCMWPPGWGHGPGIETWPLCQSTSRSGYFRHGEFRAGALVTKVMEGLGARGR